MYPQKNFKKVNFTQLRDNKIYISLSFLYTFENIRGLYLS